MMAIPPGRLSLIVSIVMWLIAAAVPAHAQTFSDLTLPSTVVADAAVMFAPVVAANGIGRTAADASPGPSRALTSLQVSFVALEALDVFSTMRGMSRGHTEANPLMRGVAGNSMAMMTVKAGATASTILLVRQVARKNRVAAIAILAATNTALSVVVARNLRAPGRP
jgi:hypothetical protein